MSNPISTFTPEPIEAFDWHHQDLYDNPPYDDYTMVMFLDAGRFIIEGELSTFTSAEQYALQHDTPECWEAIDALLARTQITTPEHPDQQLYMRELALNGPF